MEKHGVLYIVSTPIGNLEDITFRAVQTLKSVDLIAAEDTRHSKILLTHFDIHTSMLSLHDHNETQKSEKIITLLSEGKSIALISDAGTPLISDPGYHLVKAVVNEGFEVVAVPGATAAIAALTVSGLPTDRFVFEGFIAVKKAAREKQLQALLHEERTMIFYEAPHRLFKSLKTLQSMFGDGRHAVVARELTKRFETVYRDNLAALTTYFSQHEDEIRGEIVIIIAGCEKKSEQSLNRDDENLLRLLLNELSIKTASQLAAKITGKKRNDFYNKALELKGEA